MSGTTSTWVGGTRTTPTWVIPGVYASVNDWFTPANWTNGVPNGPTATAIVNTTYGINDVNISGGSSVTLASISIGNSLTPDFGGRVWVGGGSIFGGGGGTLTSIGTIFAASASTNPGEVLVGGIGGLVTAPVMVIGPDTTIDGGGTFDVATIINNGRILATGLSELGPMILNGDTIQGTGFIELYGPSTLQLNAATAQEILVDVASSDTTIIFENPATFTGRLNLVRPGSHVNLFFKDQTPTGATFENNTLIITGAGGTIDAIPFNNNGTMSSSTPTSTLFGYDSVTITRETDPPNEGFRTDLRSQIVLERENGDIQAWHRTDASNVETNLTDKSVLSWHVKGTGDFNGDGNSDLLYQNDGGPVAIWNMNGASIVSVGVIYSSENLGREWHVVGTSDFHRDGASDILFQSDDGSVAVWNLIAAWWSSYGVAMWGASLIGSNPGTTWHVKSTGDFSGNGGTDILYQNDNGSVAIWNVNRTSVTGAGPVGSSPGPTWHIKGTADFNGDGASDILFQNDDGSVAVWNLNGTEVIGATLVGSNPGPTWHVKGAYDLNEDGSADILFQNDSGAAAVWDLTGTSVTAASVVGANPGQSWQVIGTDRMNFIEGTSGPATLTATSQPDTFVLSSFTPGAYVISGFNPTQDVIEFSKSLFANFGVLQSNTGPSASDTLINLGSGSTLILQNVAPGALRSTDFVFV